MPVVALGQSRAIKEKSNNLDKAVNRFGAVLHHCQNPEMPADH
jgi:hypothetical protein